MHLPTHFEKAGWINSNDLRDAIRYIIEMNGPYVGQYDDLCTHTKSTHLYQQLVEIWQDMCITANMNPWSQSLPIESIIKAIASASLATYFLEDYYKSNNVQNLLGIEIGGGAGFFPVALSAMTKNNIIVTADVFLPFQSSQKLLASLASKQGMLDQFDFTHVVQTSSMEYMAKVIMSQQKRDKQMCLNSSIDFIRCPALKYDYIIANDCLREFDIKSASQFFELAFTQLKEGGFLVCFGFGAPTSRNSLVWDLISRANLRPVFVGMKNIPQIDASFKSLPHQTCIFIKDFSSLGIDIKDTFSSQIFSWLETATADQMSVPWSNNMHTSYYLDRNYLTTVNHAMNMNINPDYTDLKLDGFDNIKFIQFNK